MSKILNIEQIRQWDAYTIENEPISSTDLMERAATTAFNRIQKFYGKKIRNKEFLIFCGTGNNGGDGLVIARKLIQLGCKATIFIVKTGSHPSSDFNHNFQLLKELNSKIIENEILSEFSTFELSKKAIIIDAILGSGLRRKVEGEIAEIIMAINDNKSKKWSIDIPSGMFADIHSEGLSIHANYTISFQTPKLAFYFAENESRVGKIYIENIGLNTSFYKSLYSNLQEIKSKNVEKLIKKRSKHAHKGTFGHAILIAGSYGKMGAAVLAAKACLRTGVGLLTTHIPKCGYDIMQISLPEAMVIADNDIWQVSNIYLKQYNAIGIGPGLGTSKETYLAFKQLLQKIQNPIVIDADALNLLSYYPDLQDLIPKQSILTPHPKEFERLFGITNNDFERFELLRTKAQSLQLNLILKGAHTIVATSDGKAYFNTSGNPGMATAGSGDVLTGIILSLLAQNYIPKEAAIIGVFLHGIAGDFAAKQKSQQALIASDIIDNIGNAYKSINQK